MSSSSQPRKRKAVSSGAQGEKSSCAACDDPKKPASKDSKVIDFPSEKKKAVDLIHKIQDKMVKDPKAIDKAAFVIGEWINGKTSRKKK